MQAAAKGSTTTMAGPPLSTSAVRSYLPSDGAPRIWVFVAVLFCCTITGCGLIFNGRTQRVVIRSVPEGATASFAGHEVITPGAVIVNRKLLWAVMRAAKDGHQPACQVVEASRNRAYIALDAIPLAIPLLIDLAAGTLREFPDEVYLTLEPLAPGAPLRALPPDQSILDAWVRSRRRVNLCNPYLEDTRSK